MIQAINEEDPSDPTGQTKLPYVVKLDPPVNRLISVPYDENKICRAETCFEQSDLIFTLRCKPQRQASKVRRFTVGERVACAVEGSHVEESADNYTVWMSGTVKNVDYDLEPEAKERSLTWDFKGRPGVVPYRVLLDSGAYVFVHRDEHWLVRDLSLQPAGQRQAADGTRNMTRLVKRKQLMTGGESRTELIDHATRRVRVQAGGGDSGSESEDSDIDLS